MSRTAFPVTKIQNSGGNCFRERETHKNNRDLIMIFAYPWKAYFLIKSLSTVQPTRYIYCFENHFSGVGIMSWRSILQSPLSCWNPPRFKKRQPTSTTLTLLSFRNNTSELIKPLLILKSEQLA